MKTTFSVIFIIVYVIVGSHAQKLGPYLISTSGQQYTTESVSLYASIGEPINTFESDGGVNVSQGVLQSIIRAGVEGLQSCESNTGRMFFENCDDGTQFFFIEDQNGDILDPYFGEGVEFEDRDGITVNFGYKTADFATPCSQAEQAVILTCVEEATTTSITEAPNGSQLTIYPNPSTGKFFVDKSELTEDIKSLSLYNSQGGLIWKDASRIINSEEIEVSLSGLSAGIFLFQIHTNSGTISKRIVIQNK